MARPNLYLLHYNGRDDNLGDQFIFRALVEALGDLGLVHMRGGVPAFIAGARETERASAVHATPRASASASAPAVASSGHASLGLRLAWTALRGGAVYSILPPGGRTWTAPPGDPGGGTRGGVRRLAAAAKRRGIGAIAGRRIALGTSVIPAANHAWCRDCDWIGVRDHESLTALRAAGLPRVDYFPDLAFLPQSSPPPSPPPSAPSSSLSSSLSSSTPSTRVDAGQTARSARRGILASFRDAIPEARGDDYASRVSAALGTLLRELPESTRRDTRTFYQVDEDAAFARDLGRAHGLSCMPDRVALDSFARIYGGAEIVISNRLHCLLMGASCGAVPIALTSRAHTKVRALFETVGWQPLMLAIDDERALPARVDAILRDLPRWRQLIAETFAEQRALGLALLARHLGADAASEAGAWQPATPAARR